jgi:hypothetical protein
MGLFSGGGPISGELAMGLGAVKATGRRNAERNSDKNVLQCFRGLV